MGLAVFCGPSLPPEDRLPAAGVSYLPPASRGDVAEAASQYEGVLLIDGTFHHDLAPSPKECYAAAQRTRCFGASSLGALRAAECWPYGFGPLGVIAEWYIREVIDGDDEVAVLVDPVTQRALSVPVVNVRYTLGLATQRGILSRDVADRVVERARDIFYAERTWEDVLDLIPLESRGRLRSMVERDGDLKRTDARFALARVLRMHAGGSL
jgi:hypothetical protein